jgi:hypothetical protein
MMEMTMFDAAQTGAAIQQDLELGLLARHRGDRIGALAHFQAAATAAPSLRLEIEIAREMAALGL